MPAADREKFLRHAIALSAKATFEYSTAGVFGAVILEHNEIVSEGTDRVVAGHDPTWPAEMEAIRLPCKLTGCTLQYEKYQCRQMAEEAPRVPL